ncbi:hypothetical protein BGW80DRAFT_1251212 [Lactifluus volemus]|nr:hypothetical protein BGW80DRAFT_1251212 [Lactifluus volemus]
MTSQTVYTVQTAPLRASGWTRGNSGGDRGGQAMGEQCLHDLDAVDRQSVNRTPQCHGWIQLIPRPKEAGGYRLSGGSVGEALRGEALQRQRGASGQATAAPERRAREEEAMTARRRECGQR